jgi:putative ABC transport system permease protein
MRLTQPYYAVPSVLDSIRQDVAYALRGFRRSRGFTLVALLVLAFGIAANTTVFSVVNAVLLRPLPVAQPEDLQFLSVVFTRSFKARLGLPYTTFEQLARRPDVFSGVAGFFSDSAKLGDGISATRIVGERVTTGYFDVLGVHAAFGRTFVPADDEAGADPVVIISDRFWRTKLDANPNVLGTTLDLRSPYSYGGTYYRHHRVYTIVGVMPPAFKGISTVWVPRDYWVPMRQRAGDLVAAQAEMSGRLNGAAVASYTESWTRATLVVRPVPGASDATVRAVVQAAEQGMPETPFATRQGVKRDRGTIVSERSIEGRLPFDPTGKVVPERLAAALMLVPLMVVLIAAANLAGILMARGVARRGEIGVRLALGASRGRVARQMLTESLLLSLAGAGVAVALSRGFVKLFATYMPRFAGVGGFSLAAISLDVPLDGRVLLFTILLGIGTGMFVGVTPALQALRTDILAVLAGTAQAASPRSRFRRWIVVPQICFSLVLLLAAGVLVRAMLRAEFLDRGFDPSGVVYAELARPPRYSGGMTLEQRQAENARQKAEYLHLLQQVRTLPGVEIAALANRVVWTNQDHVPVVTRDSVRDGQNRWAAGAYVSDGYFEVMRLPIVRGRAFDGNDTASSPPVAVVSERLARLLWPDKDPLGEYVGSPDPATNAPPTWLRVVGIARQVTFAGQEDWPAPLLYVPIAQRPSLLAASIVARGRGNTPELLKALPAAIVAAQRDAEIPRARTMTEDIGEALYPTRLAATVLAASGLFGLLLSVVGLYGVVSYSAAQRMREIGIRYALGAERRDLLALLLRDAVLALAVAVVLGVGLGFAAVRIVSTMVVALPRLDAVTMIAVPLTLSAVILAACLRPVRRAVRVNPIDVLRAL